MGLAAGQSFFFTSFTPASGLANLDSIPLVVVSTYSTTNGYSFTFRSALPAVTLPSGYTASGSSISLTTTTATATTTKTTFYGWVYGSSLTVVGTNGVGCGVLGGCSGSLVSGNSLFINGTQYSNSSVYASLVASGSPSTPSPSLIITTYPSINTASSDYAFTGTGSGSTGTYALTDTAAGRLSPSFQHPPAQSPRTDGVTTCKVTGEVKSNTIVWDLGPTDTAVLPSNGSLGTLSDVFTSSSPLPSGLVPGTPFTLASYSTLVSGLPNSDQTYFDTNPTTDFGDYSYYAATFGYFVEPLDPTFTPLTPFNASTAYKTLYVGGPVPPGILAGASVSIVRLYEDSSCGASINGGVFTTAAAVVSNLAVYSTTSGIWTAMSGEAHGLSTGDYVFFNSVSPVHSADAGTVNATYNGLAHSSWIWNKTSSTGFPTIRAINYTFYNDWYVTAIDAYTFNLSPHRFSGIVTNLNGPIYGSLSQGAISFTTAIAYAPGCMSSVYTVRYSNAYTLPALSRLYILSVHGPYSFRFAFEGSSSPAKVACLLAYTTQTNNIFNYYPRFTQRNLMSAFRYFSTCSQSSVKISFTTSQTSNSASAITSGSSIVTWGTALPGGLVVGTPFYFTKVPTISSWISQLQTYTHQYAANITTTNGNGNSYVTFTGDGYSGYITGFVPMPGATPPTQFSRFYFSMDTNTSLSPSSSSSFYCAARTTLMWGQYNPYGMSVAMVPFVITSVPTLFTLSISSASGEFSSTVAHPFKTGDVVRFTSVNSGDVYIATNSSYYLKYTSATTFVLHYDPGMTLPARSSLCTPSSYCTIIYYAFNFSLVSQPNGATDGSSYGVVLSTTTTTIGSCELRFVPQQYYVLSTPTTSSFTFTTGTTTTLAMPVTWSLYNDTTQGGGGLYTTTTHPYVGVVTLASAPTYVAVGSLFYFQNAAGNSSLIRVYACASVLPGQCSSASTNMLGRALLKVTSVSSSGFTFEKALGAFASVAPYVSGSSTPPTPGTAYAITVLGATPIVPWVSSNEPISIRYSTALFYPDAQNATTYSSYAASSPCQGFGPASPLTPLAPGLTLRFPACSTLYGNSYVSTPYGFPLIMTYYIYGNILAPTSVSFDAGTLTSSWLAPAECHRLADSGAATHPCYTLPSIYDNAYATFAPCKSNASGASGPTFSWDAPALITASNYSCPPSFYCTNSATPPVLCPAGSFCPASSTAPMPCPANTYNSYSGASSLSQCEACASGYVSSASATFCTCNSYGSCTPLPSLSPSPSVIPTDSASSSPSSSASATLSPSASSTASTVFTVSTSPSATTSTSQATHSPQSSPSSGGGEGGMGGTFTTFYSASFSPTLDPSFSPVPAPTLYPGGGESGTTTPLGPHPTAFVTSIPQTNPTFTPLLPTMSPALTQPPFLPTLTIHPAFPTPLEAFFTPSTPPAVTLKGTTSPGLSSANTGSPFPSFSPFSTSTATGTSTSTSTGTSTSTATGTSSEKKSGSSSSTLSRTPFPSVTPSNTPSRTGTRTTSRTTSSTFSQGASPSFTPSSSRTPSKTPSVTPTRTSTRTPTSSPTSSVTSTLSQGASPSQTSTVTPSRSPTRTLSGTRTPTRTGTRTPTANVTPGASPSITPSNSLLPSSTPSNWPSSTNTPTVSDSGTSSTTLGVTPTPTPSITPSPSPMVQTTLTLSVLVYLSPQTSPYVLTLLLAIIKNWLGLDSRVFAYYQAIYTTKGEFYAWAFCYRMPVVVSISLVTPGRLRRAEETTDYSLLQSSLDNLLSSKLSDGSLTEILQEAGIAGDLGFSDTSALVDAFTQVPTVVEVVATVSTTATMSPTLTPSSSPTPSSSALFAGSSGGVIPAATTSTASTVNTPAIVGGVLGGLAGLVLLGAFVVYGAPSSSQGAAVGSAASAATEKAANSNLASTASAPVHPSTIPPPGQPNIYAYGGGQPNIYAYAGPSAFARAGSTPMHKLGPSATFRSISPQLPSPPPTISPPPAIYQTRVDRVEQVVVPVAYTAAASQTRMPTTPPQATFPSLSLSTDIYAAIDSPSAQFKQALKATRSAGLEGLYRQK